MPKFEQPAIPEISAEQRENIKKIEQLDLGAMPRAEAILILLGLKPATEFETMEWNEDAEKVADTLKRAGIKLNVRKPSKKEKMEKVTAFFTIAQNEKDLKKLMSLDPKKNHLEYSREYGRLMGFPETAIQAYLSGEVIEEIPELRDLPLQFKLSETNWQEEMKVIQRWGDAIKKYAPALYEELLGEPDKERVYESPERRFTDEQEIMRILEQGTPEELEEFKKFHNLSKKRIEMESGFARLKREINDQILIAVRNRKQNNPEMTPEEQELGLYIEYIQPQVLNAVRTLRAKGYNTISSGFWENNKQRIGFNETTLSKFDLPKALTDFLEEKQVEIYIEPDEIILTCNKFLNIDELKEVWDKIANAMPDVFEESSHREDIKKKEQAFSKTETSPKNSK